MTHPVPRDPRQLAVTPEELNQSIEEILAEPAEDLSAQAEHLNQLMSCFAQRYRRTNGPTTTSS